MVVCGAEWMLRIEVRGNLGICFDVLIASCCAILFMLQRTEKSKWANIEKIDLPLDSQLLLYRDVALITALTFLEWCD